MSLNSPSARPLRHSPSTTESRNQLVCEPPEGLTVAVHTGDGRDVLTVTGELDVATAPQLAEAIRPLRPGRELVIDLDQVGFIDSTGLNVLVAAHRRTAAEGGAMAVVCSNARTMRVMQMTGLTRFFTFQARA